LPGFRCPPGTTADSMEPCVSTSQVKFEALFCPRGTGHYAKTAGLGNFTLHVQGNEALRTAETWCPPGFSCLDGRRTPCNVGRYYDGSKTLTQGRLTSAAVLEW